MPQPLVTRYPDRAEIIAPSKSASGGNLRIAAVLIAVGMVVRGDPRNFYIEFLDPSVEQSRDVARMPKLTNASWASICNNRPVAVHARAPGSRPAGARPACAWSTNQQDATMPGITLKYT